MSGLVHSELVQAALSYAKRGWRVIPVNGKIPLTPRGCLDGSIDRQTILAWWARWPNANVAVCTGAESGVVVIDADGPEGTARIRELGVPVTPMVVTGNGMHYYCLHPGVEVRNSVRIEPGIDVRGESGYTVAPPSLHNSGHRYAWHDGLSFNDVELASFPEWLSQKVTARSASATLPTPVEVWRRLAADGVPEEQRNNATARFAGHLIAKRVDILVVVELLLAWNQRNNPPHSDAEVIKTINSIAGTHLRNRGIST